VKNKPYVEYLTLKIDFDPARKTENIRCEVSRGNLCLGHAQGTADLNKNADSFADIPSEERNRCITAAINAAAAVWISEFSHE